MPFGCFIVDTALVCPFEVPHHPYRSACSMGYSGEKLSKMASGSVSYPFKTHRDREMGKFGELIDQSMDYLL